MQEVFSPEAVHNIGFGNVDVVNPVGWCEELNILIAGSLHLTPRMAGEVSITG